MTFALHDESLRWVNDTVCHGVYPGLVLTPLLLWIRLWLLAARRPVAAAGVCRCCTVLWCWCGCVTVIYVCYLCMSAKCSGPGMPRELNYEFLIWSLAFVFVVIFISTAMKRSSSLY